MTDAPMPTTHPDPASMPRTPELSARMLTYRLIPVWVFLLTLGLMVAWEFGVKGSAATQDHLQSVTLIALLAALLIGAPIGIRWFNPLPPKK